MTVNLNQYLYSKGNDAALDTEFEGAAVFGKVRLGRTHIFWRAGFRRYAVALANVQRAFRRAESMTARGCGRLVSYDSQKLVLQLQNGTELELRIGDNMDSGAANLLQAMKDAHPQLQYGKE